MLQGPPGLALRKRHDIITKILTSLVEEDFHYPATVDASGMHLTPADDPTAAGVMDDAVDEIIETVLSKGGRVVFMDNGQLAEHQRIALILRY